MPSTSPDAINYTKEALFNTWNLVFLAVAAGVAVGTTTVPGAPEWLLELFLVLAGGVELVYLGMMPRNDRFQRHVRSQKMAERQKPPSQRDLFNQLADHSQRRYVKLRKLRDEIRSNYQQLSYASQGLLDSHVKKIDGLLESYLELLHQRERHRSLESNTTEREIKKTIAHLKKDMADDTDRVREVKKRRLRVLRQRLARTHKAHENLEIIGAQLGTIEDAVKYIHEQSWTMQSPDEVTFQLDALLEEVEETQSSVREIEDVFTSPRDFLDTDPLDEDDLLDAEVLEDDALEDDALEDAPLSDESLDDLLDEPLNREPSDSSEESSSGSSRSRVRP